MSKSLLGGCEPLSRPNGDAIQPLRSLLYELSQELSPEDYRGVQIPMVATLGATAGSATINYRVPNTHNLVITTIVGELAMVDIFNELLAVKNGSDATRGVGDFSASPDVLGRLLLKAMNCQIGLTNADRTQPLFENGKMNLSTILTMTGGRPVDWSATPHIVPKGETLQADISLVQTGAGDNAKVVGGNTVYGVVLSGVLVRVARS